MYYFQLSKTLRTDEAAPRTSTTDFTKNYEIFQSNVAHKNVKPDQDWRDILQYRCSSNTILNEYMYSKEKNARRNKCDITNYNSKNKNSSLDDRYLYNNSLINPMRGVNIVLPLLF